MSLLQIAPDAAAPVEVPTVKLDLVGLFQHAAWPIKITIGMLIGCSLLVWIIAVLKLMQLSRLRSSEKEFDRRARRATSLNELFETARTHGAPGARVVVALYSRGAGAQIERLRALADRAILTEGQGARALMWFLAFIASGAPFIGLFGTVYGIMNSFIGIANTNTTNLAVVAPGIAQALLATGIGLFAAIPAVVFYNYFQTQITGYGSRSEGFVAELINAISRQLDRGA